MNCETYQSELEDLLYGELSDARAAQLRAHFAACRGCAGVRDKLEREHEIFSQFYEQSAIDPGAEMWDAIRTRIPPAPAPQKEASELSGGWWKSPAGGGALGWLLRPSVIRQAAFALVLIALSAAITTMVLKRERNEKKNQAQTTVTPTRLPSLIPPPPPVSTPAPVIARNEPRQNELRGPAPKARKVEPPARALTDQEKLNQQIARAEREYQSAIKLLDSAIAKRKDLLDPDQVKQFEISLALIDTSIAASRRALRDRPDDPSASQFLLAAYARKVELMQDIAMR